MSSSGPALGIEMIAANRGVNGNGLGYWDNSDNHGTRAWACFRFHSASLGKFDCLITVASASYTTTLGTPFNIGSFTAGGGSTGWWQALGISFAWHPSGSNVTQSDGPWNGTYSLTSASVGSPVWKLNSAQKGGFWPRANGIAGTYSGSRNYMHSVFVDSSNLGNPSRSQFVFSEDSFTLLSDHDVTGGPNNIYRIMHFGPFLPRSGTSFDSYYFGWTSTKNTQPFVNFYASTLGVASNPSWNSNDGCVAVPNLISGSRNMAFVVPGIDGTIALNRFITPLGNSWDKFPVWIAVAESPTTYGILGRAKHISYGFGIPHLLCSNTNLAIGNYTVNEAKLIMPWSGSSPTTAGRRRTGVLSTFNLPNDF